MTLSSMGSELILGLGINMTAMNIALLLSTLLSLSLAVPRNQFYSFGEEAGDRSLRPSDDRSSSLIRLQFGSFPYFERQYTTIYVNTNGDISFNGPVSTFTPQSFPLSSLPLIAPYWADVDTRGTGTIYYRETRDLNLLRRARDDIMTAFRLRFQPIFLFIATWDRVGHFNKNTERTATFQCVLMTDGEISFTKFLYEDNGIGWTTGDMSGGTNGFGGTPAQVGFNAGDGVRFFSVPGSQTNDIANIWRTTNIGVPGAWVFQTNGNISQCNVENTPLVITPRTGNMLGGTAVSISSTCLRRSDNVTCEYEGFEEETAFVGQSHSSGDDELLVAVCISPRFEKQGSKHLHVRVMDNNGTVKYNSLVRFYAVDFEDSTEVQHNLQDLLIFPQTRMNVTWNPASLVPIHVEDTTAYTVSIVLVQLNSTTGEWQDVSTLASDLINSGSADVDIQILVDSNQTQVLDVQTVALQVRVGDSTDNRQRRQSSGTALIQGLRNNVALWSPALFFSSIPTTSLQDSIFRRIRCETWYNSEPDNTGQMILDELVPCPPRVSQARSPNSGLVEDMGVSRTLSNNFFHTGADTCFRSAEPSPSGYGQQCCYKDRTLLVGPPGGGTVDKVAPDVSEADHFQEDVIPWFWCCTGAFSDCSKYYERRPSDDGSRYNPPIPACLYGDPHIVTLDGFKYTFNGLGEFLLTEVEDIFNFQARMVRAVNPQGDLVGATVFSAIAMQENGSDMIQFQVGSFPGDPEALVDGEVIDFTDISFQELRGVAVSKNGSTLSARFSSGAHIEVREENGFLASLMVSLPRFWQGRTRGLLGNYNGNTNDDLTPQVGNSLPLDSDLKNIHKNFGISWIISNPGASIFTYADGQNWSTFYFPGFEPTYNIVFPTISLEQAANEMCGDDLFCRFDIASTENAMVGLTTLLDAQEFDVIINDSRLTVCDPPCANGACVATDTCSCSVGYTGERCETPIVTECDTSPCENGGTCQIIAGSYICTCPSGYIGFHCQNQDVSIRLRFGGEELANTTSRVCLSKIGEQPPNRTTEDREEGTALVCVTESTDCCRGRDNNAGGARGGWTLNGIAISGRRQKPNALIYRNRGTGLVRLNHRGGSIITGQACCVVPGRNGVTQTLCVELTLANDVCDQQTTT